MVKRKHPEGGNGSADVGSETAVDDVVEAAEPAAAGNPEALCAPDLEMELAKHATRRPRTLTIFSGPGRSSRICTNARPAISRMRTSTGSSAS